MNVPNLHDLSQIRGVQFEAELAPLLQQLLAYAVQLTRSNTDAEDLLQETMLRAYTAFESFQEGTNFKAWLYRIMRNSWIDAYRKSQRRPVEVSVENIDDYGLAIDARPWLFPSSAEFAVLDAVAGKAVQEALQSLREGIRAVVFYSDIWGFTNKEISDVMGIPLGTVVSRLHRGRKRLRAALIRRS
jgi:RNA polymerase sigma-70 factor, ECF subfamily